MTAGKQGTDFRDDEDAHSGVIPLQVSDQLVRGQNNLIAKSQNNQKFAWKRHSC